MSQDDNHLHVAVVGVAAIFPGSDGKHGFWRDIVTGKDQIRDVPDSRGFTEIGGSRARGAFLDKQRFRPLAFGISPHTIPATESTQLLALVAAEQLLKDTLSLPSVPRERVSLLLGGSSASKLYVELSSRLRRPMWEQVLREVGLDEMKIAAISRSILSRYPEWQENSFPGLLGNVVTGRIANRFDIRGTNSIVDTEGASALSALHMAVLELQTGRSNLVLTGGVETMTDRFAYAVWEQAGMLSPSGDCRPLGPEADGTVPGEGLGMLALRRLEDAERDGDRIYAVIRGLGLASEGAGLVSFAEAHKAALREAYVQAGYGPGSVKLLESDGSGIPAQDAAELQALRAVFEEAGAPESSCAIGSIKSQLGHAKAAAGAAGLLKAVFALAHKVLPPTIKAAEDPDGQDVSRLGPFYLNTAARPWVAPLSETRRASVSAVGYGGVHVHVTLEEYKGPVVADPPRPKRFYDGPSELFLFEAEDVTGLLRICRTWMSDEANAGTTLVSLAMKTHKRWEGKLPYRLAVVADSRSGLVDRLQKAAGRIVAGPESSFIDLDGVYYSAHAHPGTIAFLFPGQGSQYIGMGSDIAIAFEAARLVWDRIGTEVLDGSTRLHEVVFPHPARSAEERTMQTARLTETQWAQPAIGVACLSVLALLKIAGVDADIFGGHSFGEITALHAAGAMDERSFLQVARKRGELMAAASETPGGMTAVSGKKGDLLGILHQVGVDVVLANENAPEQCVFSGALRELDKWETALQEHGFAFRRLPVATGFHSVLVAPSVAPFREALATYKIGDLHRPVYGNETGDLYPKESVQVADRMARQLAQPVRFVEQVEAMYQAGVRTYVEVGPGSTLTGLVCKCLKGRPAFVISTDQKGRNGTDSLWRALAQLAVAGVAIRPEALRTLHEMPPEAPRTGKDLTLWIDGGSTVSLKTVQD